VMMTIPSQISEGCSPAMTMRRMTAMRTRTRMIMRMRMTRTRMMRQAGSTVGSTNPLVKEAARIKKDDLDGGSLKY